VDSYRVLRDEDITRIGNGVANALKTRRESIGLSKNSLAQKAGVNVQTVSFIEDCVNSPSVSTLLRLCDALGTTPEKIFKAARKAE
jgi:transcriptional regulator with XRE-family HTH domain